MTLSRPVSLLSACLLALPAGATDSAVAIQHDPVACIVAERFTKLESRFDPAEQLARGRVYFRADGGPYWYYVDLKAEGGTFYGALPKVKSGVKRVDYYVDSLDRAFAEGRTAEYAPAVVDDGGQCKDRLVAAILPGARIVLGGAPGAPPVPFGFEAEGIEPGGATAGERPHKNGKAVWLAVGGAAVAGGIAAAAGGGSSSASNTGTAPPTATIASILPSGTALVSATVVAFTAAAAGPATFQWDFGDGTSASGAAATHVYNQEGTFNVVLRATSASGSAMASASVTARSLTGRWIDNGPPLETDDLTQAGASISGTNAVGSNHRTLSGSVANPRAVSWTRFDRGAPDERLDLAANDALTQLTGTVTKIRDGSQKPVTLNRQ